MKKLNRMLSREIFKSKGQFIAAVTVIFAGITLFTAFLSAYMNYKSSMDDYYSKCNFIDYYAEAQSFTPQLLNRVREMAGVAQATGRICRDVGADVGNDKRVTIRLISMPDTHRPEINDVFVKSGGYFSRDGRDACLVSSKFATFYGLKKGDMLSTIINGRIYPFKISGIVDSPEFVYAMKSASDITISAEYFGIVYVKESRAQEILGFDKNYNQLLVTFGKEADQKQIIDKIENNLLRPYGFTGGTKRKDQLSYNMVEQDFQQLKALSFMFPVLFLATAAMIIYIMQKRMINNQRTLIGVMKAMGYSNGRILCHYTAYSLLIALIGSVLGVLVGYFLGIAITKIFVQSLNVPIMTLKIYWGVEFAGILVSMLFCLAAGFSSARKILGIHPAEAMRTEVPKAGKRIFLERIPSLWKRLSFGWKMIVRNVFRNRQRTMLTMLGVTFTITLFMVSLFLTDSINSTVMNTFFKFQRQDYKVVFSQYASYEDAVELDRIKGVKESEPFLQLPVQLQKGWKKQDTVIIGINPGSDMYYFEGTDGKALEVPQKGIFVSGFTAEKFELERGDTLELKFLNGARDEKKHVRIAGIIKQDTGTSCYMSITQLGELTGEGIMASGAMLKISPDSDAKVSRELFKIPGVSTIESKMNAYLGFTDIISVLYAFVGIMIIFGTMMGFAIIFNTTVINIMERRRELASLKVLGYNRWEIERTILGENLLVGVAGSVPGILLGRVMCNVFGMGMSNDTMRLEVVLSMQTYVIAFSSVFVFIILAQLANRKGIHGLDMVDVLKNREG